MTGSGHGSTRRHHAVALLVAVLTIGAVLAAAQTWLVRVYVVEGTSMQPSVEPGDHVLADMVGPVRRGDVVVVVLDGTPSVKRVIGMSGDHVWCCARGTHAVVVDDGELAEPYLYPGDPPSTLAFDVVVPEDAYWVMGDHRSASHDSRSVSTVPASSVIGVVRNVYSVGVQSHPSSWVSSDFTCSGPGSGSTSDVGSG